MGKGEDEAIMTITAFLRLLDAFPLVHEVLILDWQHDRFTVHVSVISFQSFVTTAYLRYCSRALSVVLG